MIFSMNVSLRPKAAVQYHSVKPIVGEKQLENVMKLVKVYQMHV